MKVIKGYLAPDLLIEGNIHTTDSARIDCTCVGRVTGNQEVDFGESAKVKGEVSAKVVRMSGQMEGDLTVEQRASLLGSSRIKGNLITPPGGFSMDLGSKFEGNFQVADAGSAARKSIPPFTEGQPEAPSTDSKKERSKSSK